VDEAAAAVARAHLGGHRVVRVHTRRTGTVTEVEDVAGARWVVKTAPTRATFRRELHAYRTWVPTFSDQAPVLRGFDRRHRVLVLSKVHGRPGRSSRRLHQQAGRLLGRIHASAEPRDDGPTLASVITTMLERVVGRAPQPRPHTAADLHLATRCVEQLGEIAPARLVPCHGDFGGHNWLRHRGRLTVIDFASARWSAPAFDFARLLVGPWWQRPDLVAAFESGYGRGLTEDEVRAAYLQVPVLSLRLLNYAHRNGLDELAVRARDRLDHLQERLA
jgi:hypothetical protein